MSGIDNLERNRTRVQRTLKRLRQKQTVLQQDAVKAPDDEALQRDIVQLEERIERQRQELAEFERLLQLEQARPIISVISDDDEKEQEQQSVAPPEPIVLFSDDDEDDSEPEPLVTDLRSDNSLEVVAPTLNVDGSPLERIAVQRGEQLFVGNATLQQLYLDEPALLRPSLLETVWTEANKAVVPMAMIRQQQEMNQQLTPLATVPDQFDGSLSDVEQRVYDSHVALQHELASVLLFDVRKAYSHGDQFGFSDTYAFDLEPPDEEQLDDDGLEGYVARQRDYLWRFSFSPHRYDIAPSLISVGALSGFSVLVPDESTVTLAIDNRRMLAEPGQRLQQALRERLTNQSLTVPALASLYNPQQATRRVTVTAGIVPSAPQDSGTVGVLGTQRVQQQRLIEAGLVLLRYHQHLVLVLEPFREL